MERDLRVRRTLPVMVAATLVLGAAGCGGGSSQARSSEPPSAHSGSSSSSTAASDPRSSVGFIGQSDAICRRLNTQLAIGRKPGGLTVSEMATLLPPRATLERQTAKELSTLTPPATLARDWRQILAYRRTLADELAQLGQDAKAKDVKAVKALIPSKKRTHGKLSALATRAGFKDCSTVG